MIAMPIPERQRMLTDQNQTLARTEEPPRGEPITYSPVTIHVQETVGVVFLGVLALTLLIALLRAEARHRALGSR